MNLPRGARLLKDNEVPQVGDFSKWSPSARDQWVEIYASNTRLTGLPVATIRDRSGQPEMAFMTFRKSNSNAPADTVIAQRNPRLRHRGFDGFAIGSDTVSREAYGPIPDATDFYHNYGYEPATLHGWQWSETFRRWSALVTFADGWHGFSWPKLLT